MEPTCRICGHELLELTGFEKLARVTSDCRPHPVGGWLGVCGSCTTVQKPETDFYLDELKAIYSGYDIYFQGGGKEQLVFDQSSGQSVPRSAMVVETLSDRTKLPDKGRLLDIGCGGGHFLKSFRKQYPDWKIFGHERGGDATARACSLVPEATILHGKLGDVDGPFDLVAINHTFEHIPDPVLMLNEIHELLADDGLLLINVPNFESNPFDLIIADHCTHFTEPSLSRLLAAQGFICLGTMDGMPKELLAVARKDTRAHTVSAPDVTLSIEKTQEALDWLTALARKAHDTPANGRAVFGTSIAAIWIFSMLGGEVDCFVDEDPARVGRKFLDRPVIEPADVPAGTTLILPFHPVTACAIRDRLSGLSVTFVVPDAGPETKGTPCAA